MILSKLMCQVTEILKQSFIIHCAYSNLPELSFVGAMLFFHDDYRRSVVINGMTLAMCYTHNG